MSPSRGSPHLTCGTRNADGSLNIDIRVQTRSGRLMLGSVKNGRLKLRLTAPPVDGKANQQAMKLLAKSFGAAPSRIKLIRGRTSRDKSFHITGATQIPPVVLAANTHPSGDNQ